MCIYKKVSIKRVRPCSNAYSEYYALVGVVLLNIYFTRLKTAKDVFFLDFLLRRARASRFTVDDVLYYLNFV